MNDRRQLSQWILVGVSNEAKKRSIPLKLGESSVGKTKRDAIRFNSNLLSRKHCRLEVTDYQITLYDDSTNGTYVNNDNCHKDSKILETGDLIGFGTRTFNIDEADTNRFIYRLDKRNEQVTETIDLVTDPESDGDVIALSSSGDEIDKDDDYKNLHVHTIYETSRVSHTDPDIYHANYNAYDTYSNNIEYTASVWKSSPDANETKSSISNDPLGILTNKRVDAKPINDLFSPNNSTATEFDIFNFAINQSTYRDNSDELASPPPPLKRPIDEIVLKRIASLTQKKKEIAESKLINAKPLRKRRQTFIEGECYVPQIQPQASVSTSASLQGRAARLAEIGEKERVAREEAERLAAAKRVRVLPKVKQTYQSRSDKLTETMLNTLRK